MFELKVKLTTRLETAFESWKLRPNRREISQIKKKSPKSVRNQPNLEEIVQIDEKSPESMKKIIFSEKTRRINGKRHFFGEIRIF